MTPTEIAALLGLNLALLLVAILCLWGLALRLGRVCFIDIVWPLSMFTASLATYLGVEGDPLRQFILVWLCGIWAVCLAWRLWRRWRRGGMETRYAEVLARAEQARGWSFGRTSLLVIFLPQAVLAWLVCLPVQLGQVSHAPTGWISWLGAAVVVIGIGIESISDAQLAAFRQNPANAGRVLETGLWRYSRHPNYFGDLCVWWGLWLIAVETGWLGVASAVGPLLLTVLVGIWSRRVPPKYADYARRTSALIPLPPRA